MITEKLIDHIRAAEGLRLRPYRCTAGKLTIGYGRNLDDLGISETEAESLLINDVDRVIGHLMLLPQYQMLGYDQARQAVLVDMVFNLGLTRFLGFKAMLAALELGDFDRAADEMLDSKWARQVGKRATNLAEVMRSGRWYE